MTDGNSNPEPKRDEANSTAKRDEATPDPLDVAGPEKPAEDYSLTELLAVTASREIDDGALYGPGLALGPSMEVFADLVTSDAQARAFDLQAVPRDADRAFIEATDYRTAYLGVVQVSGLNSSMSVQLVDIAVSADQLVLAFDVEDTPPHSDDWVITSILVRVKRERRLPSAARESSPDGIRVRLSIGDRTMTACGGC